MVAVVAQWRTGRQHPPMNPPLKRADKCQAAESITDAIAAHGLASYSKPHLWMAGLLGPLFERRIPLASRGRREQQAAGGVFVALLPIYLAAYVLTLPLELWRAHRLARHNRVMGGLLMAGASSPRTGAYRAAPGAGRADWLTAIHEAERLLAVDFRIESKGRATFLGAAVVAIRDGERTVPWLTAHRATPPTDSLDGHAAVAALQPAARCPFEQVYWAWQHDDPYELVDRQERPW